MADVGDFRGNIAGSNRDDVFEMSTYQSFLPPAQHVVRFRENELALGRNCCSTELTPFLIAAESDGLAFARKGQDW